MTNLEKAGMFAEASETGRTLYVSWLCAGCKSRLAKILVEEGEEAAKKACNDGSRECPRCELKLSFEPPEMD